MSSFVVRSGSGGGGKVHMRGVRDLHLSALAHLICSPGARDDALEEQEEEEVSNHHDAQSSLRQCDRQVFDAGEDDEENGAEQHGNEVHTAHATAEILLFHDVEHQQHIGTVNEGDERL